MLTRSLCIASLLLSSFLFSCSDRGCIEAEDFGEHESQVIDVSANPNQNRCEYDASLPLTSAPTALLQCFTRDNISTTDIDGTTVTNPTASGCKGYTSERVRAICISDCVQKCLSSSSATPNAGDPNWSSTSKKSNNINSGVTIWPGSEISIRAVGSISLGQSSMRNSFFVQADNLFPHSKRMAWGTGNNGGDFVFDVKSGGSLTVSFGGQWRDKDTSSTPTQYSVGNVLTDPIPANLEQPLVNGQIRLAAFVIPHPEGYDFNKAMVTDEKAGAIGIPLRPNVNAWKCSYTGADNLAFDCSNDRTYYNTANGYTAGKINADAVDIKFPLSSTRRTAVLGSVGGMLRWSGDGLFDNDYNPFAQHSISCTANGDCSNVASLIDGLSDIISEAADDNLEITNGSDFAHKISFINLLPSSSNDCEINLKVTVKDERDAFVREYSTDSTYPIAVPKPASTSPAAAWARRDIPLESKHKMIISQITSTTSGGVNCAKVIGYRSLPYHDIGITTSGFVSFANISNGLTATSACKIVGRIINPNGKHVTANGLERDFYEYDHLAQRNPTDAAITDPLNSLPVPASSSTPSSGNDLWSTPVFVRKGQKIRFDPESWNGTWAVTGSGSKKCGIGLAMRIIPRPALLCRGKASEKIPNPACESIDRSQSGGIIGCAATANACTITGSGKFCPSTSCYRKITCTDGTSGNDYTKTGCTLAMMLNGGDSTGGTISCNYRGTTIACGSDTSRNSNDCVNASNVKCTVAINTNAAEECIGSSGAKTKCPPCVYSGEITSATCNSCVMAMKDKAELPAVRNVPNVDQCYNLEAYTGKVSNIPEATGFSDTQLSNPAIAKGIVKLTNFNGLYGNFKSSIDSKQGSESNVTPRNRIFKPSLPLTFTTSGRLQFFVLDDKDFLNMGSEYSDNTSHGTAFTGQNGMEVIVNSTLLFNNGQWLRARLCREDDGAYACSNSNPVHIDDAAKLIDFANTGGVAQRTEDSLYDFNDSGYLFRSSASSSIKDCKAAAVGVESSPGQLFYCHLYKFFSREDERDPTKRADVTARRTEISKTRLTFQIYDPEIPDCKVPVNATTLTTATPYDGILVNNPSYTASTTNTGATCQYADISGSTTCRAEKLCINKYSNNTGTYYVSVKVKRRSSETAASFINSVIKPMIEILDGIPEGQPGGLKIGQAEKTYKTVISNPRFKSIVTMSMVVMFTFYGLTYLMGMSELNQSEIITRVIKIGLIGLFTGETGWYWFNLTAVSFFKGGTDYISFMMASSFDNSPELTNAINVGNFYDKSILFRSVDDVFGLIFAPAVQKKASALLFASIFGWAYLLIIYYGLMSYIFAVANAVLLYITAQFFTSVLFTLGPIFFVFTLFGPTKEMFDQWLKALIGFSLQQIFLLVTLAFFNMLMYEVIKMSLGYKICWDAVWTIHIITNITLLEFWTIASLPPRTNSQSQVGNVGTIEGVPSLFTILYIWVVASLMENFIGFMTGIAASISGGISASALSAGVSEVAGSIKGLAAGAAGKLWDATGGQVTDRIDDVLFDSGATADKRRADAEQQNKEDFANKREMSAAGDQAVSDYKKNNALGLAGMTKEEQRDALKDVRDKAMSARGKEMGLTEDKIAELKSSSGLNYSGTNVFGGLAEMAKQGVLGGGTLNKSLSEQTDSMDDINKFSESEAKDAMKDMSAEQRDQWTQALGHNKVSMEGGGDMISLGGGLSLGNASPIAKLKAQGSLQLFGNENRDQAIKELELDPDASFTDQQEKDIRARTREITDDKMQALYAENPEEAASMSSLASVLKEKKDLNTKDDRQKRTKGQGVIGMAADAISDVATSLDITESGKYRGDAVALAKTTPKSKNAGVGSGGGDGGAASGGGDKGEDENAAANSAVEGAGGDENGASGEGDSTSEPAESATAAPAHVGGEGGGVIPTEKPAESETAELAHVDADNEAPVEPSSTSSSKPTSTTTSSPKKPEDAS